MLTITPSLTPFPGLEVGGSVHGNLIPGGVDVYTYNGKAGDVITINLNADKPANSVTDETTQVEQSLLDTDLMLYAPDGTFLIESDDVADGQTDSQIDGFTLPADGPYTIQVMNAATQKVGGGYTINVQTGAQPTPTPIAPATPTEAPTLEPIATEPPTVEATLTLETSVTPEATTSEATIPEVTATPIG